LQSQKVTAKSSSTFLADNKIGGFPSTPDGELKENMEKSLSMTREPEVMKVKVVQIGGKTTFLDLWKEELWEEEMSSMPGRRKRKMKLRNMLQRKRRKH
jgi:hypothetical protein